MKAIYLTLHVYLCKLIGMIVFLLVNKILLLHKTVQLHSKVVKILSIMFFTNVREQSLEPTI